LPPSIFEREASWHCHLGWFEADSDGTQVLVQLNLDAVMEGEASGTQRNRLSLTNAQFVDYVDQMDVNPSGILKWFSARMDYLHQRNKDLLVSLLHEDFTRQIGLIKGAAQ
jgi:hypothetical protein